MHGIFLIVLCVQALNLMKYILAVFKHSLITVGNKFFSHCCRRSIVICNFEWKKKHETTWNQMIFNLLIFSIKTNAVALCNGVFGAQDFVSFTTPKRITERVSVFIFWTNWTVLNFNVSLILTWNRSQIHWNFIWAWAIQKVFCVENDEKKTDKIILGRSKHMLGSFNLKPQNNLLTDTICPLHFIYNTRWTSYTNNTDQTQNIDICNESPFSIHAIPSLLTSNDFNIYWISQTVCAFFSSSKSKYPKEQNSNVFFLFIQETHTISKLCKNV